MMSEMGGGVLYAYGTPKGLCTGIISWFPWHGVDVRPCSGGYLYAAVCNRQAGRQCGDAGGGGAGVLLSSFCHYAELTCSA